VGAECQCAPRKPASRHCAPKKFAP
jgi:hypothetical protein